MSGDSPREPELETLMELMVELALERVNTHLPGRIVSYDSTKQQASVQPLVMRAYVDEYNRRQTRRLPELHNVPVHFVGPANGRLTYPVAKNDLCTILWCSSSIAIQKQVGGLVDPKDDRLHDLSDAIILIGYHDFANIPTTAPTDAVVLHSTIPVKVGSPSATDQVMRKSDAQAFMNALSSAIASSTGEGAAALTNLQTQLSGWLAGIDSILRTT